MTAQMKMQPQLMNGLDLDTMSQTVQALKNDTELARFEFRNANQWISGGHNRSTIRDFYGAGMEDSSRSRAFEFDNGEPPVLLGNNEGANPVEFLLHALAGCVTTTTVLHATARGIEIRSMSTRLVGTRRTARIREGALTRVQHRLSPGSGRARAGQTA